MDSWTKEQVEVRNVPCLCETPNDVNPRLGHEVEWERQVERAL